MQSTKRHAYRPLTVQGALDHYRDSAEDLCRLRSIKSTAREKIQDAETLVEDSRQKLNKAINDYISHGKSTHTHTHKRIHTHTHARTHTTHTHVRAHTHTYTHTHMQYSVKHGTFAQHSFALAAYIRYSCASQCDGAAIPLSLRHRLHPP